MGSHFGKGSSRNPAAGTETIMTKEMCDACIHTGYCIVAYGKRPLEWKSYQKGQSNAKL